MNSRSDPFGISIFFVSPREADSSMCRALITLDTIEPTPRTTCHDARGRVRRSWYNTLRSAEHSYFDAVSTWNYQSNVTTSTGILDRWRGAFCQPGGKPSKISYFNAQIRLSGISRLS